MLVGLGTKPLNRAGAPFRIDVERAALRFLMIVVYMITESPVLTAGLLMAPLLSVFMTSLEGPTYDSRTMR